MLRIETDTFGSVKLLERLIFCYSCAGEIDRYNQFSGNFATVIVHFISKSSAWLQKPEDLNKNMCLAVTTDRTICFLESKPI